jgi:anti-anti-sigma factor
MNLNQQNGTLSVTGLRELNAANAQAFRSALARAMSHDLHAIEIDLSQTESVDGVGLGALVALYETAQEHRPREGFAIRLSNPTPTVQQLLELARHHLFEISPSGSAPDETPPALNLI